MLPPDLLPLILLPAAPPAAVPPTAPAPAAPAALLLHVLLQVLLPSLPPLPPAAAPAAANAAAAAWQGECNVSLSSAAAASRGVGGVVCRCRFVRVVVSVWAVLSYVVVSSCGCRWWRVVGVVVVASSCVGGVGGGVPSCRRWRVLGVRAMAEPSHHRCGRYVAPHRCVASCRRYRVATVSCRGGGVVPSVWVAWFRRGRRVGVGAFVVCGRVGMWVVSWCRRWRPVVASCRVVVGGAPVRRRCRGVGVVWWR